MTVEAFSASSIANSPRNSPFLLQVLACSFASTRKFICEYSRVRLRVLTSTRAWFNSITLASFDSRVGSALLACTCVSAQMILACDVASDASRSHTQVKLRLSGTVCYRQEEPTMKDCERRHHPDAREGSNMNWKYMARLLT